MDVPRRAAIAVCLAIGSAALLSYVGAAESVPSPTRIVTGQRSFVIPFALDPPSEPSLAVVEVRLLLSRDRGGSWEVAQRAEPKATRFNFRAPDDGEYWFSLQTVDRNGRSFPADAPRAGLIVVVDSSQPAARGTVDSPAASANETRSQPWPADDKTDVPVERTIEHAPSPKAAPVHSRVASRQSAGGTSERRQATLSDLPAGERPRFVAARTFKLAFDVEDARSGDIERVELWQTTDAGASWGRIAVLQSNEVEAKSPFEIAVAHDGLYGFSVSTSTRRGGSERRPRAGDSPGVWIFVDTAPPEVKITSVTFREPRAADAGGGELVIQWQVSDAGLAARPITLGYSPTPGGPWTTVAGGLDQRGPYDWPLGGRLVGRFYLRIEALDAAGNIGHDEPSEPVVLPASGASTVGERD
jgi:hypothetical protein